MYTSVSTALGQVRRLRQIPAEPGNGITTIHLTRSRSWIENGQTTQESISEEWLYCPIGKGATSNYFQYVVAQARAWQVRFMKSKIAVGPSPLRSILDNLPGGWQTSVLILQHVAKSDSECEEAKLLGAWEEVMTVHGRKTTAEMIAQAADMTPSHMLGLIVEAAHLQTYNLSKLITAIRLGEVMDAGVKEAVKASGYKDREKILQHAGLYPAPPGTVISVQANAQAGAKLQQSLEASEGLDEFERDTLESTEFLRGLDQPIEHAPLESPAGFVALPGKPAEPA